ncbi:MAG TPA: murein L,D-transpeptidase family protein [Thermoanaerobaculia bacterium]
MRKVIRWILAAFAVAGAAVLMAQEVPSSDRSREAVERTSRKLAPLLSREGLQLGAPVFLRIFKEEGILEVWLQKRGKFKLFKSYPICYFSGNLGPKLREGDGQSPEGFYSVPPAALNPNSRFHLAFNLGYPNAFDRAHDRTGSFLMVHGDCVSIGCYAMTDPGIEEIYTLVEAALRNGQESFQVHSFPFRMTKKNLARHRSSEWWDFWSNLQEGYDLFEKERVPPVVRVQDRRYVFNPA